LADDWKGRSEKETKRTTNSGTYQCVYDDAAYTRHELLTSRYYDPMVRRKEDNGGKNNDAKNKSGHVYFALLREARLYQKSFASLCWSKKGVSKDAGHWR
jgi:hypothetical protein